MIDIDQGLGPVACSVVPGLPWPRRAARLLRHGIRATRAATGIMPRPPHAGAKDIRFADAEGTIAPAMTEHAAMPLGAAAILLLVTLSASGARAQSSLPDASTTPGAINLNPAVG
jgi:hypothetical protein